MGKGKGMGKIMIAVGSGFVFPNIERVWPIAQTEI